MQFLQTSWFNLSVTVHAYENPDKNGSFFFSGKNPVKSNKLTQIEGKYLEFDVSRYLHSSGTQ